MRKLHKFVMCLALFVAVILAWHFNWRRNHADSLETTRVLLEDFHKNVRAAEEKWQGKRVKVTGWVENSVMMRDGTTHVIILGDNISCRFPVYQGFRYGLVCVEGDLDRATGDGFTLVNCEWK